VHHVSPRAGQIVYVWRSYRAKRKPSVRCAAPPHQHLQPRGLGRKEAAAYATIARLSSKVFKTRPRAKGGRGVRYARTIVNAHHVSQARMQPPCALLVRIMSPTILPRPRLTLRLHDRQGASNKLSVQKFLKRGLWRKEAAAYATLAQLSTRIT
jgi:hypothetical protein